MKKDSTEWPTLDDFVDHIDHVSQMLGSADSIGIGTDMSLGTYPDHTRDPWGEPDYFEDVLKQYHKHVTADVRSPMRAVDGFSNYTEVINLIDRLEQRGYSDDSVSKILGENYLRVFAQVWK
jgi:membrane dipeptidase